jgi:hypothetical protein
MISTWNTKFPWAVVFPGVVLPCAVSCNQSIYSNGLINKL